MRELTTRISREELVHVLDDRNCEGRTSLTVE